MEFVTITLIGLLMIISPGPDFAIVTKTSLVQGRRAGILSALGVGLANSLHVSINLLGIGLIIAQSVLLFTVLKILGAAYLLFLGIKGLRAKPNHAQSNTKQINLNDSQNSNSSSSGFSAGFITSLLNPKACLFYLSFFSVILSSSTPFHLQLCYGLWLSFLASVWFTLIAIFFTHPIISSKLQNLKHWIERVTGGALVLLGLRLLSTKSI